MDNIVVNLSGVINVENMEGKTVDHLIKMVLGIWNIPAESIDSPFVTVHNTASNKHTVLQKEELLVKFDASKDVLRVILPLKTKNVESKDSKQYLVE